MLLENKNDSGSSASNASVPNISQGASVSSNSGTRLVGDYKGAVHMSRASPLCRARQAFKWLLFISEYHVHSDIVLPGRGDLCVITILGIPQIA